MTTLRTLKKLLFGETWLLPIGIAIVMAVALTLRTLDRHLWTDAGSFVLLAGIVVLVLACVARSARQLLERSGMT